MGIQRLPSAVVSSLRTDVTVTTTAQCVTELVLNAIDAGSTSIAVRVDLKNFRIQVIDNGCGFSLSDLTLAGTRYMTSKCRSVRDLQGNLKYYGFRGEAISSISDVSGTMTIVSRYKDNEHTYCKVFSEGVALKVGKSRQQRASCGSTITVADFLYNRPVRRARIKPALDLEEVKTSMEAVAVINPHVSFSLRNDSNNDVIMQTQRVIDIPTVFSALYGNSIAKSLVPVCESVGPFSIEGYISNEAHLLKNLQFIYVNKRLLLRTKIHKLVNSIMSRSAILKSNNVPHASISKEIDHNVFLAFSPPKRDKHAVFVFNITCPLSEYDITLDPKKTLVEFCDWDSLLSCFESLLRKFIDSQAGSATREEEFDCESSRKVETVIDEINQLARQQALGGKILQANKESISTRDLSRAVHSLPANRSQVNLSKESPTECSLSSSSSEFCGSDFNSEKKDRGGTCTGTYFGSALTEQIYPPLSSKDEHGKNSTIVQNEKVCFSATPSFKSIPPDTQNKPVKGFLSQIVHFEENYRKSYERPLEKTYVCQPTPASPINPLASINEIRRKKFLNNLKKFSFNTTSKKPMLYKDPYIAQVGKGLAVRGKQTIIQDEKCISEPRSVQNKCNTFISEENNTPISSVRNIDIQSMVATIGSSGVSELQIIPCEASYPILTDSTAHVNNDQIKDFCISRVPSDNSVNQLKISEKSQEQTSSGECQHSSSSSASDLLQGSLRSPLCPSKSAVHSVIHKEESFTNILSVEDVVLMTSHDISQQADNPPRANEKKIIFDCSPTSKFGQKECEDDNSESVDTDGSEELTKNSITRKPLKIVDYDSSPSSSQENLINYNGLPECSSSSQMCAEKRKGDNNQDHHMKRLCVSGKSSGKCENISSHGRDLEHPSYEDLILSQSITPGSSIVREEHTLGAFDLSNNVHFDQQYDDNFEQVSSNPLLNPSISDSQTVNETVPSNSGVNHGNSESGGAEILHVADMIWLKKLDHSGKPFYLHKDSGMTTYLEPNKGKDIQFKFNDRFSFLPKGMSPILNDRLTNELSTSPSITKLHKDDEDLSAIKWDKKQSNQTNCWPLVDQLLVEADAFSLNLAAESQVTNASVQELSKFDVKAYNVAFPYTFTKDIFHKLRVLGQLDNKFIVTIAGSNSNKEVIVLFDQHAVHERIRVENLTEAYKQQDGSATWRSSSVEPALPLPLSSVEVRILESYKEKMEHLGLYFTVTDSNTIEVQRVPTCLLFRENREVTGRGVSVLRQHLESLIREQVDSLLNTRGVGTDQPKIIQNVISYEACRGAVKFGHSLTVADCEAFLQNLSTCDLPFQCAHGRPALVPIADLSMLKRKQPRAKPNLLNLKKMQQTV